MSFFFFKINLIGQFFAAPSNEADGHKPSTVEATEFSEVSYQDCSILEDNNEFMLMDSHAHSQFRYVYVLYKNSQVLALQQWNQLHEL